LGRLEDVGQTSAARRLFVGDVVWVAVLPKLQLLLYRVKASFRGGALTRLSNSVGLEISPCVTEYIIGFYFYFHFLKKVLG